MKVFYIPCMYCGDQYTQTWNWMVCDKCGFRICMSCLGRHEGPYGERGRKCSRCEYGWLKGPVRLK